MGKLKAGGNRCDPWNPHGQWWNQRSGGKGLEGVVSQPHLAFALQGSDGDNLPQGYSQQTPNTYGFAAEATGTVGTQPAGGAAGVPGAGDKNTGYHRIRFGPRTWGIIGTTLTILVIAGAATAYAMIGGGNGPSPGPATTVTPAATATPPKTSAPTATATSVPGIEYVMSEAQLKASLEEVLAYDHDRMITPSDTELLGKIETINKSIYFMLIGKTFEQQNFKIAILPRDQYDAVVHPNLKGTMGTVGRGQNGGFILYAALPNSAGGLVSVLASETGNATVKKEGPTNIDMGITKPDEEFGLVRGEVLDALYRAAAINKMREIGIKGMGPPPLANMIERLPQLLSTDYFFDKAWGVAWAFALDDTEAGTNLEATGWAGSESTMKLFRKYALLDFRQHPKEENVRRSSDFEQLLVTAVGKRQDYAPLIKFLLEKRMARDEQKYIIGITDTLP